MKSTEQIFEEMFLKEDSDAVMALWDEMEQVGEDMDSIVSRIDTVVGNKEASYLTKVFIDALKNNMDTKRGLNRQKFSKALSEYFES